MAILPMDMQKLVLEAQQENITRFVVGGIIVCPDDKNKILFLKRKKDDFLPGIYELPSGKVEESETLTQALYREVLEETSLKISEIVKYVGFFDYLSKSNKTTRQFNFIITCFPGELKLTEHDDYQWISINELHSFKEITDNVKRIIFSISNQSR